MICLFGLNMMGQKTNNPLIGLIEVEKTTNFKSPASILFIIDVKVDQIEYYTDLSNRLKNQFKESTIRIDSELVLRKSGEKIDKDIMVLRTYEFDKSSFESEFHLNLSNVDNNKQDQIIDFKLVDNNQNVLMSGVIKTNKKKNICTDNQELSILIYNLLE